MPVVVNADGSAGAKDTGFAKIGATGSYLFSPTARGLADDNSKGSRTATTTFVRGLREVTTLECNTGAPYVWRRVVFSLKGPVIRDMFSGTPVNYHTVDRQIVGEPMRAMGIMPVNVYNSFKQFLFDGLEKTDWFDVATAPLNKTRFKVHLDRKLTINPTNASGRAIYRKDWIPFNQNLVYGASGGQYKFEDGVDEWYAGEGKVGMGDVYIWDYFVRVGETTNGTLNFAPQATYYWHER